VILSIAGFSLGFIARNASRDEGDLDPTRSQQPGDAASIKEAAA
jgi:hypothetical protein